MILVSPSFHFHPIHTLFSDHPPPPGLPCIAYFTSCSLHLSSASMLAHVCANVTSIFHWQPLLVSRSPASKISAGLTRCCDAAARKTSRITQDPGPQVLTVLHPWHVQMHLQPLTFAVNSHFATVKRMFTFLQQFAVVLP